MDAIVGRVGERFIKMTDEPENKRFIVRIRFAKEYPHIERYFETKYNEGNCND